MTKLNTLHFEGPDFLLGRDDVTEQLYFALIDCCPGGQDASPFVESLRAHFTITGKPEDCAAMLRGYGAWEDDELTDHEANLDRLVWLTGCALNDNEDAYFSTY